MRAFSGLEKQEASAPRLGLCWLLAVSPGSVEDGLEMGETVSQREDALQVYNKGAKEENVRQK